MSESPTLAVWAYVVLPLGAAWLVFAIGFPLGFFSSGIFSGLAVYLAELYPTELRAGSDRRLAAQGKGSGTTSAGGWRFPLALGATSYGLCLVALLFLPETRGKPLPG